MGAAKRAVGHDLLGVVVGQQEPAKPVQEEAEAAEWDKYDEAHANQDGGDTPAMGETGADAAGEPVGRAPQGLATKGIEKVHGLILRYPHAPGVPEHP